MKNARQLSVTVGERRNRTDEASKRVNDGGRSILPCICRTTTMTMTRVSKTVRELLYRRVDWQRSSSGWKVVPFSTFFPCLVLISFVVVWVGPPTVAHGFAVGIRPSPVRPVSSKVAVAVGPDVGVDVERQDRTTILKVLGDHGLDHKLVCLVEGNANSVATATAKPVVAEVYADRGPRLGYVLAVRPRIVVSLFPLVWEVEEEEEEDDKGVGPVMEERTVDIGQLTTVWAPENTKTTKASSSSNDNRNRTPIVVHVRPPTEEERSFLYTSYRRARRRAGTDEGALETLWKGRVGRGRKGGGLSKRELAALEDDALRNLLRSAYKAGKGMARLVTSADLACQTDPDDNDVDRNVENRRVEPSELLAKDDGGRFRRLSCLNVGDGTFGKGGTAETKKMFRLILNGGWIAVDASVRATTEARALVERGEVTTASDERIANALERLAMGAGADFLQGGEKGKDRRSTHKSHSRDTDDQGVVRADLAVREVLGAMDLPLTPEGAGEALVRIGRWSSSNNNNNRGPRHQPFSEKTLQAARDLAQRRKNYDIQNDSNSSNKDGLFVDLTRLPSPICLDAPSTRFRDDAVGVRPRAMTGRKVQPERSKWEILIHVVDVSDVYGGDYDKADNALFQAAQQRGYSRYDLPAGPLHLLPPMASEALSFPSTPGNTRAVTVWAYIDMQTGELMDAGVEQTVLPRATFLTHDQATQLLEQPSSTSSSSSSSQSERTTALILTVIDRHLRAWSDSLNTVDSQKRERRMEAKSRVAKELQKSSLSSSSRTHFRRTPGDVLVDRALALYGRVLESSFRKARAPYPSPRAFAGRLGTAPLRRCVDGLVQRQALAVLCIPPPSDQQQQQQRRRRHPQQPYPKPLTRAQCADAVRRAAEATAMVASDRTEPRDQERALRLLRRHLSSSASANPVCRAVSTGRGNEVVVLGTGAVATCRGVDGTLPPGDEVTVRVLRLDPERNVLRLTLHHDPDY